MVKRALELFSGTHSFGKVAYDYDYDVISVDINSYKGMKPPTYQEDILEWDYQQYPTGYFKIIWASPPCCRYSCLQNSWIGREKFINGTKQIFTIDMLENQRLESDELVKKVLEILEYFKPQYYIIENPNSGVLKKRNLLNDKPFHIADYCKYSNWGYKKRTRFWTNIPHLKLLTCKKDCNNIVNKKHKVEVSRDISGKVKRYRIPPKLIKEFFKQTEYNIINKINISTYNI